jgi:hypothetical protein
MYFMIDHQHNEAYAHIKKGHAARRALDEMGVIVESGSDPVQTLSQLRGRHVEVVNVEQMLNIVENAGDSARAARIFKTAVGRLYRND